MASPDGAMGVLVRERENCNQPSSGQPSSGQPSRPRVLSVKASATKAASHGTRTPLTPLSVSSPRINAQPVGGAAGPGTAGVVEANHKAGDFESLLSGLSSELEQLASKSCQESLHEDLTMKLPESTGLAVHAFAYYVAAL